MNFEQAKAMRNKLESDVERAASFLKSISGGGLMGLTAEEVKSTPAWKAAYRDRWAAHDRLARFNALMNAEFKAELKAERRAKLK